MTGLDKMKNQILDEAKATAEAKLDAANVQAKEILAQAKEEALKTSEGILNKTNIEVINYQKRVASTMDLKRRTKLLEAKQEIISEVLGKAYDALENMETEPYFDMLKKLVDKYALPQDGEIFFSPADVERMPTGFEEEIKRIAQEKGGSLILSSEDRKIENGFILAYGGIEENCTLRSIFDAKKDELSDKVNRLLFV